MKKYLPAIVIILLALLVAYCVFDDSVKGIGKARQAYDAEQSHIESLKAQREASSNQIVSLNRSVKDSVDFLSKWKAYYTTNRDYESVINKAAEKAKCAVVGRKWETKKINVGKLDYDADTFTGMVVGDYRDIINFIGEMESQLQMATIWSLEFKEGVNEVACTMTVYFPTFEFWGGSL